MVRYTIIFLIGFLLLTLRCGGNGGEKDEETMDVAQELAGEIYYLVSEGSNNVGIFSHDLEKKGSVKVGHLEIADVRDAEISRDGRFFFYAGVKAGDSVVGIMEKGIGNRAYYPRSEFTLNKASYPAVIYDDWRRKLYVTYLEYPSRVAEETSRDRLEKKNLKRGGIISAYKSSRDVPVKKYGVVDMTSMPYSFETIGNLSVDPVGISRDFLYVIKYINGTGYLFRVSKGSGRASRLFELPDRVQSVIILNGEKKGIINTIGPKDEGYPSYLFLVPLESRRDEYESSFEKPSFAFSYYPGLTQLQTREGSGIVLEYHQTESEGEGYRSKLYLLDLNNWRLKTLFEFSYSDPLPISGAFSWLYNGRVRKSPDMSYYVNNMYCFFN